MSSRQQRHCRSHLSIALAAALLSLCAPSPSRADDPSDIAAARKLGQEGVKLANAGKCEEAIDRLSRAEILHHAPTILGRLGECQVAVGKLVEGTETLQRVVRETLPPRAPPVFVAAQKRAQKVLDAALPKIAHLTIEVQAPRELDYVLKIDQEQVSRALVGVSRPTDPGEHTIEAHAEGFLPTRRTLSLGEGESSTVRLSLKPDPKARKPQAEPKPAPAASGRPLHRTLGYVSLGVGGAGLIVGSLFGALALSKRNELDDSCVNKLCDPRWQGEIDSARTQGTLSTVGFAVAGIGIAAGTTLLLWPDSVKVNSSHAAVMPSVGWGTAGLLGVF